MILFLIGGRLRDAGCGCFRKNVGDKGTLYSRFWDGLYDQDCILTKLYVIPIEPLLLQG